MVSKKILGIRVLLVKKEYAISSPEKRVIHDLVDELQSRQVDVDLVLSNYDAHIVIKSDPSVQCVILDWDLYEGGNNNDVQKVLTLIRARSNHLPVFLLTKKIEALQISVKELSKADEFVYLLDDTPSFIAGRIIAAIERYRKSILPPMFSALLEFAKVHEYSWHTPGHTGGTGFLKSPVGKVFFDYFGENLLRSDLSISVGALGSLLAHSGPIGEGEKYAAKVFGADRTYYVTNGSSTSNRVILMASVTRNQVILCDRNCHKSVEHAITMSGAIPVYLMPSRNHYGLIGPIFSKNLQHETVKQSIDKNSLISANMDKTPVHAIITNSTYDGLCYNVTKVVSSLGQVTDRLHFDEAWYGYARFNPIYDNHFAMYGDPAIYDKNNPSIFATQSTHKVLVALSQASMIHVREGRNFIDHTRFNESFMMHASTSPNYAILASNDVSASMMEGRSGEILTTTSIREAITFRQLIARTYAEFKVKGEWFFNAWQPETIIDPQGKEIYFYEAELDYLTTNQTCWSLQANAEWHGFGEIEADYCLLDPIKVSITTPGIKPTGEMEETGIPASIVSAYLTAHGILVERTTDFTFLILFSLGITKGKWATLVSTLLEFKVDYDTNKALAKVLPELVAQYPKRYQGMGLKDLADEMYAKMKELQITAWVSKAFSFLPTVDLSPSMAYEYVVKGDIEKVSLNNIANRTIAIGVISEPPAIPLLMPGENVGDDNGVILTFLRKLEAFDIGFPGLTPSHHGIELEDSQYKLYCLKR